MDDTDLETPIDKKVRLKPGLRFSTKTGKWSAYIKVGDKNKFIGNFEDRNDAIKARQGRMTVDIVPV